MIKRAGLLQFVFGVLLAGVIVYYGLVHWRLIWLVEPAAARESALVIDVRGFLDPAAPRPYSLESFPGYTNLYGIGYIWGAAPFAALLPFSEYSNLRIANAFYLVILLLLIAYGLRKSSLPHRIFGTAMVYALYVSSPSIAASPDILACVLYLIAWLVAAESDLKPRALCVSIFVGFLALLTKPYLVLVVPAIGSYLFFFRSIKSGVLYTLATLAVFAAGLWLIHIFYPYYFVSVFGVHFSRAIRDPLIAIRQWWEMLLLAPVLCILAILLSRDWLHRNSSNIKLSFRWEAPVVYRCQPVGLYAWGALVAVGALAVSLAWHDGAHMIYFWHLLLPLLVLVSCRWPSINPLWLSLNLLLLLVYSPPLPAKGISKAWCELQAIVLQHQNIYLDPFLEALRPAPPEGGVVRENAQSEYLLAQAFEGNDLKLQARAVQFLQNQMRSFQNQEYDGVLLTEGIFDVEHLMPFILSKYKVAGVFRVYSYYLPFRNRLLFGKRFQNVIFFEPLKPGVQDSTPAVSRDPVPLP